MKHGNRCKENLSQSKTSTNSQENQKLPKKEVNTMPLCDSGVNNIHINAIMKILNVYFTKMSYNYTDMIRKRWKVKKVNTLKK